MGEHELIKADPRRPYKAYAAGGVPATVAVLTVLVSQQGVDLWPPWVILLLNAGLAGFLTWKIKNPKVRA